MGSAAGGVGVRRPGRPRSLGFSLFRCELLSAAQRRRLRRGSSLRPQGQLAAAQAGEAALRVAAGGGGAGHDGGGSSSTGFRARAAAVVAVASPGAQGTWDSPARLKPPAAPSRRRLPPAGPPSPFLLDRSLCPRCCLSAACRAPAAALCACAQAAQPPIPVAALRCGTALSTFCE